MRRKEFEVLWVLRDQIVSDIKKLEGSGNMNYDSS